MSYQKKSTKFSPQTKQRLMSLAVASACAAFVAPAFAQTAAAPDAPQTVVVTGLRASMQSTLNLKRNSDGIVDGIVAADIGKFPDSNLAESLQRISGVSIDRNNGEGQKITVRGMGPDFNLVLLNGRQMPTSDLSDPNGRSFDFGNLASEAVSQLQVYKTSRADNPTGGIGATVNIMTARPFDNPGMHASMGVKGVYDSSSQNLPQMLKGAKLTPEVSGIYTNTSADGVWGVAASASYQKRDAGANRAQVTNGYVGPYRGDLAGSTPTLPQPGTPGSQNITNRPGASDLYEIPQNFGYQVLSLQRERINGQVALQFRPFKELTTTLDYTYSENKLHTQRSELSVWFAQTPTSASGASISSWPGGHIQAPLTYAETYARPQDISVIANDYATKSQNNSLGFNTKWKASSTMNFEVDAHHSTAESQPDSPWGSNNQMSNASFSRGTTKIDFTQKFPVLSIAGADLVAEPLQATGSQFQNTYVKTSIDQIQLQGDFTLFEASHLKFGLAQADMKNRSTQSTVQNNGWSGLTSKNDYPASLFSVSKTSDYFSNISGNNSPALFNQFFTADFGALRQATSDASTKPGYVTQDGLKTAASFLPKSSTDSDQTLEEKTTSAFGAFNTDWDGPIPIHTSFGLRVEKTKVTSIAQQQPASAVVWVSQNELPLTMGGIDYATKTGEYNNVLPSVNTEFDVTRDVKVRASAGETITRARYNELQGGLTLNTGANYFTGGTASGGNPALKPVKSKNIDLSFEWYYDKESTVSLGLFSKKLSDYTAQNVTVSPQYNIHTPIGGAYYLAARDPVKGNCALSDTDCIRNYILNTYNGQPGVVKTGVNNVGNATGTITGLPTDPLLLFSNSNFVNQNPTSLSGAEIALQHMFGKSGFGIQANYTYVHSPLKYKNDQITDQFAITGLSNSANLVGIYENYGWSVRIAYNWRDQFLASKIDGGGHLEPVYTDKYGQLDTSINYEVNKNLTLQFDTINLTNSLQRQHGRTQATFLNTTQTGPRFMVGARYKF
jgi:TonB-dependent receptor